MTSNDIARIERLMTLATGDEKHDSSSRSTLDVLWVLYDRILRFDPYNPRWENRDRFVLSKGHGCVSYYAILADKGFFPTSTLKTFVQFDSILGAHPDRNQVPGVEASTGSLGHGLPMAVGIAIALRLKKSDRRVFALIGDGECNEGTIWEAFLLAGNLQLSNLTCIAINNHSSSLELGDLTARFATFGWASTTINGHDHDQIYKSLSYRDSTRPTAIVAEIG
ncbi:MAG TPA: transketolase [Ktedonobacteraceae bacterium]|nr:transketolase [Ktedonobacteraceae bacterium]HXZ05932.1 transketolase [Ktedonobacteraceae bacterium]